MTKFSMFTPPCRPLRVGTDCSGIDAPIVALQQLGIPISHEFSTEIDKHCIATIRANFSPKIIFGDMTQRPLKSIPDIDLYVCGFPCQPFSTAGKRLGERDPRGTIFWECIRVIKHKKPMVFILENVPGIMSIDKGNTFRTILESLQTLKMYDVQWKILNTADYGIPQSRKRVFIVGIRRKAMKKQFKWPSPIKCRPLEEFVDWEDRTVQPLSPYFYRSGMDHIINRKSIFINDGFRRYRHPHADRVCPCLTGGHALLYNFLMKRRMNIKEMKTLQGFPDSFHVPVSTYQAHRQFGNTMSINVLLHLFRNVFRTLCATEGAKDIPRSIPPGSARTPLNCPCRG